MDTLRGTLHYFPNEGEFLRISTNSSTYDLWKKIEPTFWSLCGNNVIQKRGSRFYSLGLGSTTRVFHYKSREYMFLKKAGGKKHFDVASHLTSLFLLLHNRNVVVEADTEHFKIFADKHVKTKP